MAAEEHAAEPEDDRPELLVKLQERKRRHQARGRLHRLAVVALGVMLIPIGMFLSAPGVPGPGFAVILLGISFLALEFDPAERFLERVIVWGDRVGDRVKVATPREKGIAAVLIVATLAAAVAVVVLWDVPLVPVL
jgi:Putative transmembrane protein (PGPGW)